MHRKILYMAVLLYLFLILGQAGLLPVRMVKETDPYLDLDGREITLTGQVLQSEPSSGGSCLTIINLSINSEVNSKNNSEVNSEVSSKNNSEVNSEVNLKNNSEVNSEVKSDISSRVLVYTDTLADVLNPGDGVSVYGIFNLFEDPSNPGMFDLRTYYNNRHVIGKITEAEVHIQDNVRISRLFQYWGMLIAARQYLVKRAEIIFDTEDAGLFSSILMGDKGELTEETKDLYQQSGISHLLAVSGLHVSLVGMGLFLYFRKKRLGFAASGIISSLVLLTYGLFTGMSISAKRAMIMFVIWIIGQILGRKTDRLSAIALAAILVLWRSPGYVNEGTFYLTFGCILSIEILKKPIADLLRSMGETAYLALWNISVLIQKKENEKLFSRRTGIPGTGGETALSCYLRMLFGDIWEKLVEGLAISCAVTVGTLPIMACFYYQITPFSILLNILVVPVMSVIFCLGSAAICIGIFIPAAGTFIGGTCHYIFIWIRWLCLLFRKLPGAMWITGRPEFIKVLLYYGVLAGILFIHALNMGDLSLAENAFLKRWKSLRRKRGKGIRKSKRCSSRLRAICRRTGTALLFAGVCILLVMPTHTKKQVVFMDVGQGDCILIQYGAFTVLIDGGSSSVNDVWKKRISPCLRSLGIQKIDMIFLTHGDLDHVNGVQVLLEAYEKNLAKQNAVDVSVGMLCISREAAETGKDELLTNLQQLALEKEIPVKMLQCGTNIRYDELALTVLYPLAADCSEKKNENSLVLQADIQNTRLYLMGDLEKDGEEHLAARLEGTADDGKTTILKAGHHGSRNATGMPLIYALHPDLAVISCGKNNRYGHPAQEVLDRLDSTATRVWRTDQTGALLMKLEKDGITFSRVSADPCGQNTK